MAKGIYRQEGKSLDYKNVGSSTIKYADVVAMTNRIGIAECDIEPGQFGTVSVSGVYELPCTASETYTVGQTLYYNTSENVVMSTASSNIECGFAVTAKTSRVSKISVKIG